MKTVFITGSSTGIGYECAKIFMENGWNVVATMRNPQNAPDSLKQRNVLIVKMDVTDDDSIKNAIREAICKFEQIDVLVNNAGYYTIGVVEAIPEEEIRRQIETNLLGLIYTTKAVIPHMREKRNGLIINLSSVAGKYLIDGGKKGSSPRDVARKIYIIAESRKRKMQYVVGKSTEIVALSKILPDKMVRKIIKETMMR